MLGVAASRGRTFTSDEDRAALSSPVAVLSHACWQRRFGGDTDILNKTITLNGVVRTVVGVMPERFNYPKGAEVYGPIPMTPELMKSHGSHGYYVIGRLKSGS